jgi:glucose 1-dehydrogenase
MDIRESKIMPRVGVTSMPLAGQKALITGANSGIGKAVAIAMAEAGAAVVVNYVTGDDEAHAIADQITGYGGRAIVCRADVSNEYQVAEMFEEACAVFGTLDIVVANAGLQRDAPFEEMTSGWREQGRCPR